MIGRALLVIAVASAAGCSKDEVKTEPTASTDAPSAAGAPKKEAPKAEPAKPLELEEVSDDAFGYSVKIVKGSKTLAKDTYSHTYSYPLPGGLFEYNVAIGKIDAANLDAAVKNATMIGSTEIADKKELSKGTFLVVKAPQGKLQEVHVFTKGKKGALSAKCAGPAEGKDTLIEICSSLAAK